MPETLSPPSPAQNVGEEDAVRWMLPIGAFVMLVVGLWLPQHESPRRLRVAPGLWPGSEGIVLAHAQGRLSVDQFQLIELPWSSAAMRALGNGAADVGVFTLDGVLRMLETGQDLRVLMVLDESRGADMVLARAGVESVAGLRGKRVGVDVRGAGIYILLNALESVGMAPQDVRLVPMVQPELEQALADEAVDAVVASEPWASHLRQAGMHAIFDSRSLKVPVMRMMVASGEACRLYRPQLQELMKAQADLTKKLRSGQAQDEMNLVLRREKISRETFQESLMKWQPLDGSRNAELLAGVRPKLVEIASAVALQMQQGGLLGNLPKNDVWIDAALMQEVWR